MGFHDGGTRITEGAVAVFTVIFFGGGFLPPVFLLRGFAGCVGVGLFVDFGLVVEPCVAADGIFFVPVDVDLTEAAFGI